MGILILPFAFAGMLSSLIAILFNNNELLFNILFPVFWILFILFGIVIKALKVSDKECIK